MSTRGKDVGVGVEIVGKVGAKAGVELPKAEDRVVDPALVECVARSGGAFVGVGASQWVVVARGSNVGAGGSGDRGGEFECIRGDVGKGGNDGGASSPSLDQPLPSSTT